MRIMPILRSLSRPMVRPVRPFSVLTTLPNRSLMRPVPLGIQRRSMNIKASETPNPETLKFDVDEVLCEKGNFYFTSSESAKGSLLAEQLFEIPDIQSVMVSPNFISVTKQPTANWMDLISKVGATIKTTCESGERLIGAASSDHQEGMGTDIETDIKALLDEKIRPSIAEDGGDVIFHHYDDGVLTLQLQGACSGCPSATITLKDGIERLLKFYIPELKEVVQL